MSNTAARPTAKPDDFGDLKLERNCWRIEDASKASVIVDADEYFRVAREAMLKARHRIMLIGWDFDARIALGDASGDSGPEQVGDFIYWLVQQNLELEVFLLRWDIGALKAVFRGSTIVTVLRWMRHPRIHTKLDGSHPPGASHHQKIVVIDDCFAFCGGIDMTGDRWDTPEHRDEEPRRRRPNGEHYGPWHDATTAIQGKAASALGDLARDRWKRATGKNLNPVAGQFDCWPRSLLPQFADVPLAISRSEPEMPGHPAVLEIERLFVDQVRSANRFIYFESQYFASRRVAEAIAERLEDEAGPEIVIINPLEAQGWLEPVAMDTARARLYETLKARDRHGRLKIYHPFTTGGKPIYVHAKIMVADDLVLRVGSSNLNNRSMRLDTECDVTIDARAPHNQRHREAIANFRNGLLAEHLDVSIETVAERLHMSGSLIKAIELLRGDGKTLRAYQTPNLSTVEAWLADNEVLDPEGPSAMFEVLTSRGLFRRFSRRPS